ncbi:MAG: RloB family protein [Bacteroidota bacterium]
MPRKKKPSGRKRAAAKPRRLRVNRSSFLIVCEGETEENYFKSFQAEWNSIKASSYKRSPYGLVETAIGLATEKSFEEIWAVFDLDYNPSQGPQQFDAFRAALKLAEDSGVRVAYSIDAFEIWFRLHYENITTPIARQQLYEDLSRRWAIDYSAEGKTSDIFSRLQEDPNASLGLAMERARVLFEKHIDTPFEERPSLSTVYILVHNLSTEDPKKRL